MSINKTAIASIILTIITSFAALAQGQPDSILFRAMQDEIDRGMQLLSYKDYAKPCYIAYEIYDNKDLTIQAELGAIANSDTSSSRSWSFRLIVGSYEINDENFSGQNEGNMGMGGAPDIFPVDNDYWGIRRAFWLNTNDIYLRAGANHREKLNLIERGKIKAEALQLNDFAHTDTVELMLPVSFTQPDIENLEKKMAALSDAFYKYPELDFSTAFMRYHQNIVYFASSETTRFRVPVNNAYLSVSVRMEEDEENTLTASFSLYAKSPSEFPSNEELEPEIEKLVKNMADQKNAEKLENDYNGPILIIGNKASQMLMSNLFDYDKGLYAERETLVIDYNGDVYFEEVENKWQSKLNKKILGDGVTITALPKLTTWQGKPVLGSYPIDSEGVIPPDSIVLVENGVLKNMLSSRTPTNITQASNGHYPYVPSYGGVGKSNSPSVIKIEDKNGQSVEELKARLIEIAREEDLEYALIARTIPSNIVDMPYNLYKVNLNTGEETLLKELHLNQGIDEKEMKKIRLGNETTMVHINPAGYYDYMYDHLSSCIGPNALLVESFELNTSKDRDKIHTAGDELINPLKLVERPLNN